MTFNQSGWSFNTWWVYGRPAAQWQHRTNGTLLCYLYRGNNFSCVYKNAIRLRWFTDQKGK